MALPEQQNGAALHFALNRLMQAQQAGLLGLGGNSAQFSHDPRQLLSQYHQFSPMIAQQVHQGASLNAPTPQPLAAPAGAPPATYGPGGGGGGHVPASVSGGPLPNRGAVPGIQQPTGPYTGDWGFQNRGGASAGGQSGAKPVGLNDNQVKVNITLPHHSPATASLFQQLMGMGRHY